MHDGEWFIRRRQPVARRIAALALCSATEVHGERAKLEHLKHLRDI